MPLKLAPTCLGSGIDKDRAATPSTGADGRSVACGDPESLRWFWSLTVNGPMTRSDRVASLEEAKAQFPKGRLEGARAKLEATRELLRVKLAVHLALVLQPIVNPATRNCLGLFPSAAHPYNRGVFTFVRNTGIVN